MGRAGQLSIREGNRTVMESMGVDLSVDEGVTSARLHDEWLRLYRRCREASTVAGLAYKAWDEVTPDDGSESAESPRLWAEYVACQSDCRVLCAWRDLLHTAWVFSINGRGCRFLEDRSDADDTLVSIS